MLAAALLCVPLLLSPPAFADEPESGQGDTQGLASPAEVPEWAKDLPVQFVPMPTEEVPILEGEEGEEGMPPSPNASGPEYPHMPYHGGQVQNQVHVHLIFWGSNWNQHDAARDRVVKMFQWISGSSWMGILSQYFDMEGPISKEVALSSFTDTRQAHPTNVTENSLDAEALWAINNQGWGPTRFDDQFIVLPAPGSSFAAGFIKGCGYHSYSFNHGINVLNVPWPVPGTAYEGCMTRFPAGSPEWYHLQWTAAHEFAEAATDPIPPRNSGGQFAGWSIDSTVEIGNLCRNSGTVMVAPGILLPRMWDNYLKAAIGQPCVIQDANPVRYEVQGPQANVSPRQATVSGSVTPAGYAADYQVELHAGGQIIASQPPSPQGIGAGFAPVAVGHTFTGLKGNTTYTAKLTSRSPLTQNPDTGNFTPITGTTTFTTPDWRPIVTTTATPTYPLPREAQLSGTVNPQGASTTYQIEWGPTTSYGSTVPISPAAVGSGTSPVDVSQTITDLKGSTIYHFRIAATNDEGTAYSADQAFTTPDWRPLVEAKRASAVTEEEATLEGKVHPQRAGTTYQFEYGETQSYGYVVPVSPASIGSGNKFLAVQERIGGLKPETLYYYRLKATNEDGVRYSDVDTFSTFTTKATPATFLLSFGNHGSGNGQLSDPRGIAVDAAGNVWVADTGNDRVVEFDSNGQFLRAVGVTGTTKEKLSEPVDVALDGDGGIWVAEDDPARLVRYASQGQFLSERAGLAGAGTIDSLALLSGQRIIASQQSQAAPTLVEYTPSGASVIYTSAWQWPGVLTGLASNAAGNEAFAVNETRLKRLLEAGGKFSVASTATFGWSEEFGPEEGQVDHPRGLALRPSGNLLVADTGNERVQQFSPAGEVLGAFVPDASESEAVAPIDIAVGPGGAEYITTTSAANQVEKWLQPSFPEAVTGEATEVQPKAATIKGTVDPVGRATAYHVEFGNPGSYSSSNDLSAGFGFGAQSISVSLSGLKAEKTYSYRVVATNKQGTVYGAWKTFTTKPLPVTDMASAIPATPQIDALTAPEAPLSRGNKFTAIKWSNVPNSNWKRGVVWENTGWAAYYGYPYTSGAFWSNASFSANGNGDAVGATLNATSTGAFEPAIEKYFAIWLNMPNPGTAKSGYQLRFAQEDAKHPDVYKVKLSRWTNGSETVLKSLTGYTLPVGKRFALADKQGNISAWVGEGGEFTQLLSTYDETYSSGYVGFDTTSSQFRLLDFRGGALPAF